MFQEKTRKMPFAKVSCGVFVCWTFWRVVPWEVSSLLLLPWILGGSIPGVDEFPWSGGARILDL